MKRRPQDTHWYYVQYGCCGVTWDEMAPIVGPDECPHCGRLVDPEDYCDDDDDDITSGLLEFSGFTHRGMLQ